MQSDRNRHCRADHTGSIKGHWAQHPRPGTLQTRRTSNHMPKCVGGRASAKAIAEIECRPREAISIAAGFARRRGAEDWTGVEPSL